MLKETIICIVIVLAIIFGDKTTQNYTTESVSTLSSGLMALREGIAQNNKEKEKIKNDMESIYQQWEQRHDKLAYFIEHDELEKVTRSLVVLEENSKNEEYETSLENIAEFKFWLYHFEEKEKMKLKNFL